MAAVIEMPAARLRRLVARAVGSFGLDLRGSVVLTEAATGAFALTPVIAALAGADRVTAVTRGSAWGSAGDARSAVTRWASVLEAPDVIEIHEGSASEVAAGANVVTNLGFVRPIDRSVVERLAADAAVALMWETWEHRPADVDLAACRARNVPVLGTLETDRRLRTFEHVGTLGMRLVLDAGIEVVGADVLVVGSPPFGVEVAAALERCGAAVIVADPTTQAPSSGPVVKAAGQADAVLVVEHRLPVTVIGAGGIPVDVVAGAGATVVRICGNVDLDDLRQNGVPIVPDREVPFGQMSVTTAALGPRPVIDLHTAGLRVGQALVEAMRATRDADAACAAVLADRSIPAMGWPS